MGAHQHIAWLKNEEIDKAKWDQCIQDASNGLIYASSFYLDTMSKHWDGLVLNDYEAVMPLTWNRKYGIYYLYQPFFTAALGIFGNALSAALVKYFLESVPEKFRFWDIYLNHGNLYPLQGFALYPRSNYVLELHQPYQTIVERYSQNHVRNIRRAGKSGCSIKKNIPVKNVIAMAKEQNRNFSEVKAMDYRNFNTLFEYLFTQGKAITYGVFDAKMKLMTSAVFLFSHQRAYYILVGNDPDGRRSGASHFLIDSFIRDHAGNQLLLDFEGSQVKSLAQFYQKFGATEEKYPGVKKNALPFPLRYFKK